MESGDDADNSSFILGFKGFNSNPTEILIIYVCM